MVFECPIQFLLSRPDREVVQDNITVRIEVILGFGDVLLRFTNQLNVPICRTVGGWVSGLGLVFEILDDLDVMGRRDKTRITRSDDSAQGEGIALGCGEDIPGQLPPELMKGLWRGHHLGVKILTSNPHT